MEADLNEVNNYSWALTLRGIAAIFFGIAAIFWPGLTLVTLVYLMSAYILVAGIVRIVVGVFNIGKNGNWILQLLLGLLELGVGVFLVRHVNVTLRVFLLVVGLFFVANGIIEIVSAFRDSRTAGERTMLIIIGAAALLAGIFILLQPVSGGLAFVWVIGLYALISGPLMIAMSLDVRRAVKEVSPARARRA